MTYGDPKRPSDETDRRTETPDTSRYEDEPPPATEIPLIPPEHNGVPRKR